MRMVTVKPRIWNVIVTGIYIPPFGRQNRPSLRWGLRGSNEPYIFYQTNRNLSTKPPLDKSGASGIIKITQGPFRKNGLASDQVTVSKDTKPSLARVAVSDFSTLDKAQESAIMNIARALPANG